MTALLLFTVLVVFRKKKPNDKAYSRFFKALVLFYGVIAFARYFFSDAFVHVVNDSFGGNDFPVRKDILQTILRWGFYTTYVVYPMAIFFDSRLFKNIAVYFCLPFVVLSIAFFDRFMFYFLSPYGTAIHTAPWFRYAFFMLELIVALVIPLLILTKERHTFHMRDKTEWKHFLVYTPLVPLVALPPTILQSLFGRTLVKVTDFSPAHIGWMIALVVLAVFIYKVFRFKDYRTRYMLCVFLSLSLFYNYNFSFLRGVTIPHLPIQLCNLGAYFFIICIPLKLKRMFQFCFVANIVGALIAIITPDMGSYLFSYWGVHYILEHTWVMMIPLMAMLLRVFPRPDNKSLKYVMIGFSIYFVFCLICGTILNGYADQTGTRVNFFFMFDLEKAFDFVPFMRWAGKYVWQLGRFELYPVVQGVVYVGYMFLCYLFYLALRGFLRWVDDNIEMRKSRMDLWQKVFNKPLPLLRDFPEQEEEAVQPPTEAVQEPDTETSAGGTVC